MDEIPELPVAAEAGTEITPPPITSRDLTRDALLDLLAALGIGLLLLTLTGVVFAVLGFGPNDLVTSGWGIASLFLDTQLPLLWMALRRRKRNREKGRPHYLLFGPTGRTAVVPGISTGFGLALLSGAYSAAVVRILGPDSIDNQLDFLRGILENRGAVALLVFIITILAPIVEEVFFRGVVFGAARAAGRQRVGLLLSATLFAAVHLIPLLAPFYAAFALVMCWLYTRTGTLLAPIAAHMTMNSLACVALFTQSEGMV